MRPFHIVAAVLVSLFPSLASRGGAALPDDLALPATNESMAGEGPVRRADWFLQKWAERRQHFVARADVDRGAIVFLGDSITEGWGDDFGGSFPGVRLANRGIGGDTTRGMLYRLERDVISLSPKAVVLLMGTNDLEDGARAEMVAGNLRRIVTALRARRVDLPVVVCAVFPSSPEKARPPEAVKALNLSLRAVVDGMPGVLWVDTWTPFADESGNARLAEFPDLLHPNAAGYVRWAEALRPVLKQLAAE